MPENGQTRFFCKIARQPRRLDAEPAARDLPRPPECDMPGHTREEQICNDEAGGVSGAEISDESFASIDINRVQGQARWVFGTCLAASRAGTKNPCHEGPIQRLGWAEVEAEAAEAEAAIAGTPNIFEGAQGSRSEGFDG